MIMITVGEIIEFFVENAYRSNELQKRNLSVGPIIESWIGLEKQGRVVIQGQIHNHPRYVKRIKITTSSVQRCFANEGRVYVKTKSSIYELGTPRNESGF